MGPYAAFEAAFSEHVILDGVPVRAGLPLASPAEDHCGPPPEDHCGPPPEDHCAPLINALTPTRQKGGEGGLET